MATSRTGTGQWKRVRAETIKLARDADQTRCPLCNTLLDYDTAYRPDSAEVDHIVAHAKGGRDIIDNARVICRDCNVRRGDGSGGARHLAAPFPLSRPW